MLGELERHLDPLLAALAEVEDPADAGLEPGLLDRVDRPQPALVADRRGDLGVVGARRSRRCDGRAGRPASFRAPGAVRRDVADRHAALQVRVLGDEPGADEHLLEVAFREPLSLGDHAEPVRAGRLGGAGVLEDLLGLHHRVHRRVGLGVARLRAEAAVLGAAAGLGVDQRAHVGRVREPLAAHRPGALDERADLGMILELAEAQRLFASDQRRHGRRRYERPRTASAQRPRHSGRRFSANARTASPKSSEDSDERRSSSSSRSTSGSSWPRAREQLADHALVAPLRDRRVRGDLDRELERLLGEPVALGDAVDQPPGARGAGVDPPSDAGTARACAPRRSCR